MDSRALFGKTSGLHPSEGFALGAGVTLGWVIHDFAVFLGRGEPRTVLQLVPGSLVALVVGGLVGALLARRVAPIAASLGLLLVASLVPAVWDFAVPRAILWLPRAAFLIVLGYAITRILRARGARSAQLLAVVLGVGLCAAKTLFRHGLDYAPVTMLLAVVLGLVAVFLGSGRRTLGTLAAVCLGLGPVAHALWETTSLDRPDLDPPVVTADPGRPNLLLILLDTVRADHLALYGYERVTTPALDRWVRDHFTLYTNSRSTSSWTLPSTASVFTGLFPSEHGASHAGLMAQPIRSEVATLAERLRDAGYQTSAIASNRAYLRSKYGLDRGYEHFDNRKGTYVGGYLALAQLTGANPRAGHLGYKDARRITDLALDWLEEGRREGAFFLTLNYLEAHFPYLPPPPHDRAFDDDRPTDPLALERKDVALAYDRELAYLDTQLDRLFAGLQAAGLFEDTVVIVTSDHGESLGDHGLLRHGLALYDELLHVPLFVKSAGPRAAIEEKRRVSGAEVFWLALAELGFDSQRPETPDDVPEDIVGEWYFGRIHESPSAESPPEQTERDADRLAWMHGSVKIIVSSTGKVEAYDLSRDPDELEPLQLEKTEVAAARARARAFWDSRRTHAPAGESDEDELERMRALGYLGG